MPPKGKSQRKNKKGKGGRGGASSSADRHHAPKKMQEPCEKGDTTASEPSGVTSHQDDHEARVERQHLEMPSGAVSAAVASAIAAGYVTPSMQKDSSPTASTITSDSQQQPKPSSLSTSTTTTHTIPPGAVDAAVKAAIAAPAVCPILDQYSTPSKVQVATSVGDVATTTNKDDQKIKSAPQPKISTTHDKLPPIPPKSVDAAVDAAIAAPVATQMVETLSSAPPSESHESTPPPPLPKEPQQPPSSSTEVPKDQRHDVSSPSPATPTALKEEETDMTEQSISEAMQSSMVQPPPRSVQAPIPSSQIPSMSPSPPPLPPPPSEYYRQRRQETGRVQQPQQRQQQPSLCRIL